MGVKTGTRTIANNHNRGLHSLDVVFPLQNLLCHVAEPAHVTFWENAFGGAATLLQSKNVGNDLVQLRRRVGLALGGHGSGTLPPSAPADRHK